MFVHHVNAEWRILGNAVLPGTQAILEQKTGSTQEFVWIGQLTNQEFKLTDGTKIYTYDCGDNDPLEQPKTLREQINDTEKGFRIRYVQKNQYFKATLTTNGTLKTILFERLTPPQYIYIMGGPFNKNASNWILEDAVQLEHDPENPFIFYYRGYIRYNSVGDLGGSVKFLIGKSWSDNYHPSETGGDKPLANATKMRLGGEDNKWSIPADRSKDGYYVIKVNTMDLTITVEQFIKDIDETPLSIFLTGSSMLCGWSNSSPITMQKKDKGIYQWRGATLQGQFKVLKARNSWAMCYVATSADERIVLGKEHDLVYEFEYYNGGGKDYKFFVQEAGEYIFTINLNTMKLRVDDPTTDFKDIISAKDEVRVFAHSGKLFLNSNIEQSLQSTIYTIDGRQIIKKTFAKNTEISLPKGLYLVTLSNSVGQKIANIKTLVN